MLGPYEPLAGAWRTGRSTDRSRPSPRWLEHNPSPTSSGRRAGALRYAGWRRAVAPLLGRRDCLTAGTAWPRIRRAAVAATGRIADHGDMERPCRQHADGRLLCRVRGQLILVNASPRQLLGQREDPAAGLVHLATVYRLHRADGTDYPADELPVSKALRLGIASTASDVVVHRPDGRRVPLFTWAAPVYMDGGAKPSAAVWVMEDLSALQQAEPGTSRGEARLRAVFETLTEGVPRAESARRDRGQSGGDGRFWACRASNALGRSYAGRRAFFVCLRTARPCPVEEELRSLDRDQGVVEKRTTARHLEDRWPHAMASRQQSAAAGRHRRRRIRRRERGCSPRSPTLRRRTKRSTRCAARRRRAEVRKDPVRNARVRNRVSNRGVPLGHANRVLADLGSPSLLTSPPSPPAPAPSS